MSFSESGISIGDPEAPRQAPDKFRAAFELFRSGDLQLGLGDLTKLARGQQLTKVTGLGAEDDKWFDEKREQELATTYKDWNQEDFKKFVELYRVYSSVIKLRQPLADVATERKLSMVELIDKLVELKPYL